MEKRNWKHIVTLKQRMVLCLAAFFAAFALQLALNGYQARAVQQVQDDQMGNFNAISRFQGGVESSISILEAYRWENGETEEMLEKLQAACSTSNAWLWRIRSNMDGLQNVSDEQWVLYGAVETTYGSYNTLLEELESYLSSGQEAKASQLYYNKVSVCGGYLSQYTMQLLKASILDAQTTYTEISELGERIALMQDRGGGTVRGAGLCLRSDGHAAADSGVSDDRGLPRYQPQPVRYPGHPAAQAAGDRPAGGVLQPHEALYGAAGEHLTGEK